MEASLRTQRLELLPITRELVEAVLVGDRDRAEELVEARFPDLWPGRALVERAFSCPIEKLRRDPDAWLWGARVLVTKPETASGKRIVVGSVVLNGRPDTDGTVEVAYGVDEAWQGHGYATEGTSEVVRWALRQREVERVQACTFQWHRASQRVLEKVGMRHVGFRETDMFGDLFVYERRSRD
ncbi:MAG TPA: GNAT family N-acetyltransferase [Polyangiaceae bacterium]|nr:GNAT family N-acetyltransferase [Polyangiaceae bacterium]